MSVTQTKRSAGPWKTEKTASGLTRLKSAGGKQFATFMQFNEANAELAATAPQLLDSLKLCLEFLPVGEYSGAGSKAAAVYARDAARRAIAKAEGGAS